MNTSLSTFMKIALTAVVIVALLFGVAYAVIESKTAEYENEINNLRMPDPSGPYTPGGG